jgi:hypothetical protein
VREAIFDPDLEQGGNANVVVRRDPTTGKVTRVLTRGRFRREYPG